MKVIAHRGAVNEALENSFTAFDLAVEAGADRIELDVHLTVDDHLIVMHDYDLLRTAGVPVKTTGLSRKDAQSLSLRNGDQIPFLDEVLERYLDKIEINVEMKGRDGRLGEKVGEMVSANLHREKLILSCFNADPLIAARSKCDVDIACLIGFPVTWPLTGLTIPLNFMRHIGARIIHPNTRLLNDNFVDQAKSRGWIINSYCELEGSEEEQDLNRLWTSLTAWEIDGHCTNQPRQLKEWIGDIHGLKVIHKEAQLQMER